MKCWREIDSFLKKPIFVKSIPYLLILMLLHGMANANPDTLRLRPGFREIEANSYFHYFNSTEEMRPDSALSILQSGQSQVKKLDKVQFGPVNGYFWFIVSLQNATASDQKILLEIQQPHIYRIAFFRLLNGKLIKESETGIAYNFYQRPIQNRHYYFPIDLKDGEKATIVLMVHHLNSLTLPLNIVSEVAMQDSHYRKNLWWGYWLGFLSFSALFALLASMLIRKSVFLWYFFYITSVALYGFTELGFSFQFIFPGIAGLDAPAIIHTSVYTLVFLIKFSQNLLETKKHLHSIHRILNAILYFMLVMIAVGLLAPDFMFRYSVIALPTINVMIVTALALMTFCGIRAVTYNKIIGVFYLITYLSVVGSGIFLTLYSGMGIIQYAGPNPVLIAYFIEAMILSIALVVLYRQVEGDRSRLLMQVTKQQKEMYQQYIFGIEKERSRIAGELHDDVGSRLSHLKRLLQTHSEASLKTAEQLDLLIRDVRQLSHDLAPPLAHVSGLIPLLEKLIADYRQTSKVDIKLQVFNYSEVLTGEQIQQAYRIVQEALNNIVHHAEATKVEIQIFGHPHEIDVMIEDNGKGFTIGKNEGLGLTQMRIRTESLGGRIEINSHSGGGTSILVQVPVAKKAP